MRILITNDDGIHSPGLETLKQIAQELSHDVWVVAPEMNQSGVSHSLTLHTPLRRRQVEDKIWAISGTPTDCVLMGVLEIMKDKKPSLILSGINKGRNAATDVTYSGTIAGAIEGTMLGIPSIALSLAYNHDESAAFLKLNWQSPLKHGPELIRKLVQAGWPENVFLNINFPDCKTDEVEGVEITRQGHRDPTLVLKYEERFDMSGDPYYWLYYRHQSTTPAVNTDQWAMLNNCISVTPLHLDFTHETTIENMKNLF